MKRITFLSSILLFSLCAGPVHNIGSRHDREEAAFIECGKQFPAVCQVAGFASGVLINDEYMGRYGATFTAARVSMYASWIEDTVGK